MTVPPRRTLTPIALAAMELLHQRPMHPYELHQTMRDRATDRLVKLTAGTLYHAIDRLAADGLIEVVETGRAGRRPERTTYRLTEAGRDALGERVRELVAEPATEYPHYPVAISLVHTLARADAMTALRRRTIALEARIAADGVIARRLTEDGLNPLFWADLDYEIHLREAELAWTRRLLARIEGGELTWAQDCGAPPRLGLIAGGLEKETG